MAATVVTITPDMGEMNIKQHVDDAFDSLFSEGSVSTTGKGRVSGHGQSSFAAVFNANAALLKTGLDSKATGTLSMATKPTADDTVTIGTNVYTFVETWAAEGDVEIGALVANSQANLVAAINGSDGNNTAHASVVAGAFAANAMVITAKANGVLALATTETFTDETDGWAAATMSGGRLVTNTSVDGSSWHGMVTAINSTLASIKAAADAV